MLTWKTKNPKSIAAISLLAILSAVFLYKIDDTGYSDGGASNKSEDESLQRYLAIPASSTTTAIINHDVRFLAIPTSTSATIISDDDDTTSCTWSATAPTYRKHSPSELELLKRAHECTKTHIHDNLGGHKWTSFEARIPMLDCGDGDGGDNNDQEQLQHTLAYVQSIMKKYQRIYFVGDSIMGQQFALMKCMLDSESRQPHYDLPVEFDHSTNSLSVISETSSSLALSDSSPPTTTTHMEWVKWGYRQMINGKMTVPYEELLPDIMAKATENDAIIIDAAVHYTYERMLLLKEALEFIKEQAMMSDANVFYMEAPPQEFKTRNGNFGDIGLSGDNDGCVKLTDDAILGKEMKYPEDHVSCSKDDHDCIEQLTAVLDLLYTNREPSMMVPPATWRSDLARLIFATSSNDDGGDSPFEGGDNGDRAKHNRGGIKFVPIFWQLAQAGQMVNIDGYETDCTHKSLSATFLMNFQLLRALKDSCTHMFQMEED